MREINYEKLPKHMREGMKRYIENGHPPGEFLRAVLTNDLMLTFRRADDINIHCIQLYLHFLIWEMPAAAFGSEEQVKAWTEAGGMNGLKNIYNIQTLESE